MPRPPKPRNVCRIPGARRYGPCLPGPNDEPQVLLTIDEFEAIRLIDLEGYTQEEAAKQMDVARTTIQRISDLARKKIASAIVNGRFLAIEGGPFRLRGHDFAVNNRPARLKKKILPEKGAKMKRIAMALDAGKTVDHFGHCHTFAIYDVNEGKIEKTESLPNPPHQPGFLPGFLAEQGVDVVITGSIGVNARNMLTAFGIETICGAVGKEDKVISEFLANKLVSNDVFCQGHGLHEHHGPEHHHG